MKVYVILDETNLIKAIFKKEKQAKSYLEFYKKYNNKIYTCETYLIFQEAIKMTEREKAINDVKEGMTLISGACQTCSLTCLDCPFRIYCDNLPLKEAPRNWKVNIDEED